MLNTPNFTLSSLGDNSYLSFMLIIVRYTKPMVIGMQVRNIIAVKTRGPLRDIKQPIAKGVIIRRPSSKL